MVIQINVKNPEGLKQGDILIFDGKKFDVVTKEQIVEDLKKDFKKIQNEIVLLKQQNEKIREQVNQRQKRFLSAFVKRGK